ncbi:MAG TPA: hypothetical protein K8V57_00585, partial [Corynebacterium xerosis]|nr:hypothetical protein [Corynebacterium xerosis]
RVHRPGQGHRRGRGGRVRGSPGGRVNPAVRLGAYALILAVVFVAAYFLAGIFVPDGVVQAWMDSASTNVHGH